MKITIEDFDFKVSDLTEVVDVDKLIAEYELQIKSHDAKLKNREVKLTQSENRSEGLDEDIQELEATIASKELQLTQYAEGSNRHTEITVTLAVDKARLEVLKFRRGGNESPLVVVERNADAGEERLLLHYYTEFRDALLQRKTELGG